VERVFASGEGFCSLFVQLTLRTVQMLSDIVVMITSLKVGKVVDIANRWKVRQVKDAVLHNSACYESIRVAMIIKNCLSLVKLYKHVVYNAHLFHKW